MRESRSYSQHTDRAPARFTRAVPILFVPNSKPPSVLTSGYTFDTMEPPERIERSADAYKATALPLSEGGKKCIQTNAQPVQLSILNHIRQAIQKNRFALEVAPPSTTTQLNQREPVKRAQTANSVALRLILGPLSSVRILASKTSTDYVG